MFTVFFEYLNDDNSVIADTIEFDSIEEAEAHLKLLMTQDYIWDCSIKA